MERLVYRSPGGDFTWVDVVGPTKDELHGLAAKYGLHPTSVEDCLDPWHLPKYERFDGITFVILRAVDPDAGPLAGSVQEVTRKIAIFARPEGVLTVHRVPMPSLAEVEQRFTVGGEECTTGPLLAALVNAALDSYGAPLERVEDEVERFEEAIFTGSQRPPRIIDLYVIKRRVNILKRLIWQTNAVVQRMAPAGERMGPVFQDVRENAESYQFYADHLLDAINNLLGIYVALSSHRTNEVMRLLTVFSAFFLPLTFIVGIYGMNFRHMPELELRWGYPVLLSVMGVVSLGIATWFWRRGWLRHGTGEN